MGGYDSKQWYGKYLNWELGVCKSIYSLLVLVEDRLYFSGAHVSSISLIFRILFQKKLLNMTDSITPPEGQLSFSGIPSAEFVEDVDAHMAGEESAESQLKVVTSLMLDKTIIENYI